MTKDVNITGMDSISESEGTLPKEIKLPGSLSEKKIAISVSKSDDLDKLGLSEQHLNDISIEVARYIICNGGTALYGGDLRSGGFTEYFAELSNQYKRENDRSFRFINYFPFPKSQEINREIEVDFRAKQIKPEVLPLPAALRHIDTGKKLEPNLSVEDRVVNAECLRDMREKMSADCAARVLVGGMISGYAGFLPGIIEEAWFSLLAGKPVYLIGGFGGATANLISLFKGNDVGELSNDSLYDSDFLNSFRTKASGKYDWMDFDVLKAGLSKFTVADIAASNKLSVEENEILFNSKNIHEVLFYVMKGLKRL